MHFLCSLLVWEEAVYLSYVVFDGVKNLIQQYLTKCSLITIL